MQFILPVNTEFLESSSVCCHDELPLYNFYPLVLFWSSDDKLYYGDTIQIDYNTRILLSYNENVSSLHIAF